MWITLEDRSAAPGLARSEREHVGGRELVLRPRLIERSSGGAHVTRIASALLEYVGAWPSWAITNRYWTFANTSSGVTRTAHEGTLSAPEAM